jgi:hypothetical protein
MAGKRFHITPTGPKRCTATFRPCPYSEHYSSVESALAADAIIQDNNAFKAELKRLHDSHRNPDPKYFSRTSFNFGKGSTSPRNFAQEIDARIYNLGVRPEIYHSMGQFRMNNGNGMEVNVQVMRMTEVDENLGRYVGVWRFINKKNKVGLHRHPETVADVVFDFSNEQSGRRSMAQIREFLRTAVISSGVYDEEDADKRADEMAADFKNMFYAVESDAAGDFDLWDRGMGYFIESDSETIIANEEYKTTAFRGENFRKFIEECPYYKSTQPQAEIRVTDRHNYTNASWTIKKEAGQWSVDKVYADGRYENVLVNEPQDALDHVYYHNLAEIDPGNEQLALEKGRYANDLVKEVDEALEKNKPVVAEWWRQQDIYQAEAVKGKITKDIYDLDSEPKGSLMNKIFENFT